MSEQEAPIWVNRIVGYSEMDVDQLLANPANFREHPSHQRALLTGTISELGVIVPVIQNDRTGNLIDGHLRIEEAMKLGVRTFPVIHVDLSEDEENLALVTMDAISAMALENARKKAELLGQVTAHDDYLTEYLTRELERQQASMGHEQSLTEMSQTFGDFDPTAFWPVIRIKVPPDVRARFMSYFKSIEAEDDVERLSVMLDRLQAPEVDPNEYEEEDDE